MSKLKIYYLILGLIALFVVAVAASYFIYGKYFLTNKSPKQIPPTPINTEISVAEIKEFLVAAEDFKFSPNEIIVSQGDKVRLTIKSVKGSHDLKFDKLETISNSENDLQIIEFTALEKGQFEFYCPVSDHRQKKMVGKLIVN